MMPSRKSSLRFRTGVKRSADPFVFCVKVVKKPCAVAPCSPANTAVSTSLSPRKGAAWESGCEVPKIDQAQAPGSTLAAIVTVPLQMKAKTCWLADWFSRAFCGEEPGRS